MTLLHRLRSIVRWIVRRDGAERDLHDELETFVDMAAADKVRDGAAPADARRQAVIDLGGIEQTKERVRAARRGAWLDDLGRDVRYGVRQIRRNPAFSAVVVATLALGVGLTASVFAVLHAVVLRPLPFPAEDRLVMVWQTDRQAGTAREPVSVPDFLDFTERSRQIEGFGILSAADATVQLPGDEPAHLAALSISSSLPALLGVEPITGRLFAPAEYRSGAAPAVLISERLWARVYNRRLSAIGTPLRVNGRPATIAGVASDAADFGVLQILSSAAYARGFADRDARTRVDVWLPLQADRSAPRGYHGMLMIGRLAAGATPAAAQAELSGIAADLERTYPQNEGRGVFVEPIADVVLSGVWTPMALLAAGVVLVLLAACGNLAILVLARGTARTSEVVVRMALGAERRRILRQFLVENMLLSGAGAACGLLLAYWTLVLIRTFAPAGIPRIASAGVDGPVVLVACATAAVIAFALGLLPLAQIASGTPGLALASQSKRDTGAAHGRLRSVLVAAEIAVAVLLLTSAGLLARSLWRIYHVDPGFEPARVVKAELQLPLARYPFQFGVPAAPGSPFARLVDGLIDRAERLPGVDAVALSSHHPLDAGFTTSFAIAGAGAGARQEEEMSVRAITPGYFATMRVPMIGGRPLDGRDTAASVRAAVVNQAFVDRFLTAANPLGQRLQFLGSEWTVVGVAGNERFRGVTSPAAPAAYVPLHHAPWPALALVARTAGGDPAAAAPGVRRAVGEIDPALAMFAVEPLEETLATPFAQHRWLATLLGLFAVCAVALATIGVYGVLSYAVAQKTPDIGVRVALGADRSQVLRLVAREVVVVTGAGTLAGIGLALATSRSLTSYLFEVTPTDPVTIGAVVALVCMVAAAATAIPARRALGIDPLVALRMQ
jgi:putative ABC transport system permease protein